MRLQRKLKLEKVSPANTRIMRVLMKRPDFELDNYLNNDTEMTRQSVLMFDVEYRQRHAAHKFE